MLAGAPSCARDIAAHRSKPCASSNDRATALPSQCGPRRVDDRTQVSQRRLDHDVAGRRPCDLVRRVDRGRHRSAPAAAQIGAETTSVVSERDYTPLRAHALYMMDLEQLEKLRDEGTSSTARRKSRTPHATARPSPVVGPVDDAQPVRTASSRSSSSSTISRPRSASIHRLGIVSRPSRNATMPPVTQAVVSVSLPRAIAARTLCS
jgi:hypothetical protein